MKDALAGFTRTEKGLILYLVLTVFLFGGYFLDVVCWLTLTQRLQAFRACLASSFCSWFWKLSSIHY